MDENSAADQPLSEGSLNSPEEAEQTSHEEKPSKIIRAVFLSLLLDLLGFTLILPLLPSILDHYSQKDVSHV